MPGYSPNWRLLGGLVEAARQQDGVVARAQLHALGITRHRVRGEVRAGRWQPIGSHVVALFNGTLSPGQRRWAALLNAGPRAALAGPTAAALDGLTGFESTTVHVLVPHGIRPSPMPGVVVHASRRYVPELDLHPARLPPRTRLPRSIVDAAGWVRDAATACGLLAAAVQQRLTTVAKLRAELEPSATIRHRRLLLAALGDIEGGAQSFAEIDAARLCRAAGLPAPVRQAVRTDGSGRRRYLDLFWDGTGVCAEIDGSFHLRERDWRLDMDRQNEIVADGIRMLRFPVLTLRLTPERFVDQVRRALRNADARGLEVQAGRR